MADLAGTVMAEADRYHPILDRLIKASHKSYIDLESFLPWSGGVDRSQPPKKLDQLWIYGTPYWEDLSEAQRLEVAWLETARDVSMFIHLEHFLPFLYGGYVNDHKDQLDSRIYEYLMLFSREELTHIMAFRRYMRLAGLPMFSPPVTWSPFTKTLPTLSPETGILSTLVIEWIAELGAMHGTQSAEVDPLTRRLFHEHHVEEVRHITFAKAIGSAFFERAPADKAEAMRQFLRQLIRGLLPAFTYNPEIARFTSFRFPIQPDDGAAIAAVQGSDHNNALNAARFREFFDWCGTYGIH